MDVYHLIMISNQGVGVGVSVKVMFLWHHPTPTGGDEDMGSERGTE
jgi:hypothetical protein